jgi:dihydrofolate reductase
VTVNTIDAVESVATSDTIWIAGGAEIYQLLLPKCSDLYLTRVHQSPEGDTFFPEFEKSFQLDSVLESNDSFSIEHWKKS